MICAASRLNWCDAVSIAHDRLDHPIEFDLSSRKAGTISGAGGVTRCLDGRELVSIARARGKGLGFVAGINRPLQIEEGIHLA